MARNLSTFSIAEMLRVDPGSVANWIDQNLLKAHRTPGGHRRVAVADLLSFLRMHGMPVPPELDTAPTIVVVDDDVAVAGMIVQALRERNGSWRLLEAHDGFKAGTLVATVRPDVVVLDLRMPGMDGYRVCQMIKSQDMTRHVEIIAITAIPSADNEQRILECGARLCLSKPLDMDQLVKEIQKLL